MRIEKWFKSKTNKYYIIVSSVAVQFCRPEKERLLCLGSDVCRSVIHSISSAHSPDKILQLLWIQSSVKFKGRKVNTKVKLNFVNGVPHFMMPPHCDVSLSARRGSALYYWGGSAAKMPRQEHCTEQRPNKPAGSRWTQLREQSAARCRKPNRKMNEEK